MRIYILISRVSCIISTIIGSASYQAYLMEGLTRRGSHGYNGIRLTFFNEGETSLLSMPASFTRVRLNAIFDQ